MLLRQFNGLAWAWTVANLRKRVRCDIHDAHDQGPVQTQLETSGLPKIKMGPKPHLLIAQQSHHATEGDALG
jgi:hypothetical protein